MPFDLNSAVPADAPPAPAPAAPRPKFDLASAVPATDGFEPIDNRSVNPLDYAKEWLGGVAGAIMHPNPHEELPRAPGDFSPLPGVGALEAGASALTGLVSPVTGAAVTAYHRLTDDPNYPLAKGAADATYSPRTQQGAQANDALGAIFKPVGDITHAFGEVAGENAGRMGASPRTQADIGTGTEQAINTGLAFVGGRKATEPRPEAPPGTLPAVGSGAAGDTVARLRSYGMLIPPDMAKAKLALESPPGVQPSVPGHVVSGLVNRGPLHEAMTIENAKVVADKLGAEFGLPPGEKVTPERLQAIAKGQNPAYDMVAQAMPTLDTAGVQSSFGQIGATRRGNPLLGEIPKVQTFREQIQRAGTVTTQQALDAIREWRADAGRYFNATGGDAVVNEQTARAYRTAADALENEIGRQLQAGGNQHIFDQFEAARTLQAKVHNVLDSWNGEHLDPQQLARLEGQGVQLTGHLADIADAARNAPDVVRSPTGSSLASPSAGYGGHIMPVAESEIRRLLFDKWGIGRLLSDKTQNQYGLAGPVVRNTIAPPDMPFGDPRVGPIHSNPDIGPPRPPEGPLPGGAAVDFEPTPPGPALAGMAPGVQPGASVGLADALFTDPHGTANPWPEIPGPSDLGPSGRPPRAGGPIPQPGNLNIAPPDAHTLPMGLSDLLAPQSMEVVPWLPPELQAIRDMGRDVPAPPAGPLSGALADLLAHTPEGPPAPLQQPRAPGAGALRPLADELNAQNEPRGQAGPEDFGGGVPVEPQRPAPTLPGGGELSLGDAMERPAAPDISGGKMEYVPPKNAIVIAHDGRSIALEPVGDRLVIRHTEVAPEKRGKGLGQQNLVDAVEASIRRRKPLDSDVSFTKDAWRAWQAALKKGVVEADNVPYDAINAAMEQGGGVARNPTGESWIKDIRLGPNAK